MKQAAFLIMLLLSSSWATYTAEGLDYILRSIEYEASAESGTLTLVLFDLAPRNAFHNVLGAILRSPRLSHTVKYVVNGTDHEGLARLPWHPSILLIHPGKDIGYLKRAEVMSYLRRVLELFNPMTKTLVFVDFCRMDIVDHVELQVFNVGFASMVFYDCVMVSADLWNRWKSVVWMRVPSPIYLFTWLRRRYLNTEASEYLNNCDGLSGVALNKCMEKQKYELAKVDLRLESMYMRPDNSREFAGLPTGRPVNVRVAIPRDRPLNVAELMVMPFSWNVWLLLVVVLVLAEVVQQLFPNHFKNDPTLLVVCGFERHNLHHAGTMEKIMLLSMIILVFFASNVFETKMLSMMISKPSIQRIKTVDGLLMSDIKFYDDLEARPYLDNQTIFGKMIIQGHLSLFDTIPGVGMLVSQNLQDVLELTAYDYERMQPWYVLLDIEYGFGLEFFQTKWRYENMEIFRYVNMLLVQGGIMDHWQRDFTVVFRQNCVGRRYRVDKDNKVDLNFEDMQPAWMILIIGWNLSLAAFGWEVIKKYLKSGLLIKTKRRNFSKIDKSVDIFEFE